MERILTQLLIIVERHLEESPLEPGEHFRRMDWSFVADLMSKEFDDKSYTSGSVESMSKRHRKSLLDLSPFFLADTQYLCIPQYVNFTRT